MKLQFSKDPHSHAKQLYPYTTTYYCPSLGQTNHKPFRFFGNINTAPTTTCSNTQYTHRYNKSSCIPFRPHTHSLSISKGMNTTTGSSFPTVTSFSPTIDEKHMLSSYYKTSETDETKYYFNKYHKKQPSEDEKNTKRLLYKKYNINKHLPLEHMNTIESTSLTKNLPTLNDNNNVLISFKRPFFKNIGKARQALSVNKQILNRVTEMGNCIQIEKYGENIEMITVKEKLLASMPKVRVKKINNQKAIEEYTDEQKEQPQQPDILKKKSMSLAAYIFNSMNTMKSSNRKHNGSSIQHIAHLRIEYSIAYNIKAYKPTSRSYFSVNVHNHNLYLFGGLNSKYNNDIWCYSFQNKRWEQIKNYNNDEPVPRYGHTAILMEHYIVIYGGVPIENYSRFPADILLFNALTQTFSEPRLTTRLKPGYRKGHVAVGISQTMLIHGGIDIDTNEIYKSAFVYSLMKNCWNELEVNNEDMPYLMYHSAVVVNDYSFTSTQPYSIYKAPSDLPQNKVQKNKNEGVFMFGGMNKERRFCNDVYVIKICRKPCKVSKIKVNGKPPEPRINAKMIYMHEYNMVIIHGGCGEEQQLFNDIAIINMNNLCWIWPKVEIDDSIEEIKYLMNRTEHEIFSYGGKIYILGGRDVEKYHKMDFEVVMFQINT